MDPTDPYSASRITRGVAYLVSGKAVTSIAGIGTFLLLVRALPVEQFAVYSILFALVEIVDAITGVGLNQILSRYVPELYVNHRQRVLLRLVAVTLAARIGILTAFLAAIYAVAPTVSALIGLTDWAWAVKAYLGVVLLRVIATTLFGVLESMLHQAIAQLGFGLVTVLRFTLLALAFTDGALDLQAVIMIELATDAIGCGVMLIGLLRAMRHGGREAPGQDTDWIRSNRRRLFEFGMKGYFQHMLILPYGGSINRLLVGGALASGQVALFGFAQSVADLMERYLPVKLLAGVIRPVLTARYVRDRRFADLQFAANLIFKINAIVICLAAVVVFGGGEAMISLVTAGKYGTGSVGLLLIMCALVFTYSMRHMLDQVSHAVERNGPLIWSNAIITLSVLPGIGLLPVLGVYALPAANTVGIVVGCSILIWRLRTEGFDYRLDLAGLMRLLGATVCGFIAAEASRRIGAAWVLSIAAGATAYAASLYAGRAFSSEELKVFLKLAGRASEASSTDHARPNG